MMRGASLCSCLLLRPSFCWPMASLLPSFPSLVHLVPRLFCFLRVQAIAAGEKVAATKREHVVQFGLNHVTTLVEEKRAKFVVIAHDVDPIELVVWLPALCRKMDVPYCIIKGKSTLGAVVHQKTATCLALTSARPEDEKLLTRVQEMCRTMYNDNLEGLRKWGGGELGLKTKRKIEARAKVREEEARRKAQLV
jgi:large subunit ribosomal protein L7Ae